MMSEFSSLKDYCTFYSNNKSKLGYCGVVTFVKKDFYVKKVTSDKEGRWLLSDHNGFKVLNVYFPYFDEKVYKKDKEEKKKEVIDFYHKIEEMAKNEKYLIIVGDFNAVYAYVDHYQYVSEIKKVLKINNPDLMPSEKLFPSQTELPYNFYNEKDLKEYFFSVYQRKWLFSFLQKYHFYDSFRKIHPSKEEIYTCWNTLLNLRKRNLGTRIDLILVSNLINTIDSDILNDVYGSDHCPVTSTVEVEFSFDSDNLCTKKNNLLHFFKKVE